MFNTELTWFVIGGFTIWQLKTYVDSRDEFSFVGYVFAIVHILGLCGFLILQNFPAYFLFFVAFHVAENYYFEKTLKPEVLAEFEQDLSKVYEDSESHKYLSKEFMEKSGNVFIILSNFIIDLVKFGVVYFIINII